MKKLILFILALPLIGLGCQQPPFGAGSRISQDKTTIAIQEQVYFNAHGLYQHIAPTTDTNGNVYSVTEYETPTQKGYQIRFIYADGSKEGVDTSGTSESLQRTYYISSSSLRSLHPPTL